MPMPEFQCENWDSPNFAFQTEDETKEVAAYYSAPNSPTSRVPSSGHSFLGQLHPPLFTPLSPPHSWPGPRTPHLLSPDQRAANHARASRDWPAASSLPSFPIQSSIQLSAVVLCSLHFIPFHVLVLKTATWSSSFYDCASPTPDIRATQTCLRQGEAVVAP
jgi:hypothetical protein